MCLLIAQKTISDPSSTTLPHQSHSSLLAKMTTNGDDEVCNSKYVTLIARDGFEFVVLREATMISPAIKKMLRGPFSEAKTGRCEFPHIQ